MSHRAIYVAAVAALGIAGGVARAEPWYNPNYSTGSYSPSYSTGGYYHPGFSVKFRYPDSDYSYYSTSYYNPGYAAGYHTSSDHTAVYCAHRFKSYDPASGTYLGYDGRRRPCP